MNLQLPNDPIRVGRNWHFPDGTVLPVVSGGSEDGGAPPPPAGIDPTTAPAPPAPPAPPQPRTFTTEEIEAARRQERDKVYKQIDELKEQNKRLLEITQSREEAEEQAAREAEEARKRAEEAELEAKELLKRRDNEWSQRFDNLQSQLDAQAQEVAAERELARKEREYAELLVYKQQRLSEAADDILPELRDFVTGATREEVDQSISALKERSALIIGNVAQAVQQTGPLGQRGPSVTAPPVGPMENEEGMRTLSAEEIKNMPMGEYAKYRDRLLNGASSQAQQGLYG